ncbi:MAG: CHRD domain-containing protein [Novosphingobium sp.]|nr:CHRD domain-containing protein [Novosphingobium sp.]
MPMSRVLLLGGTLLAAMSLPSLAAAKSVTLTASLNGANETAGGNADGSGSFTAEVDADAGDFCYMLAVDGIGEPTAAHIHSGAAGADGAPVTSVEVTGEDLDECVALEPDTLAAIVAAPGDYYVNVHTAQFPAGAVRGQLAKKK